MDESQALRRHLHRDDPYKEAHYHPARQDYVEVKVQYDEVGVLLIFITTVTFELAVICLNHGRIFARVRVAQVIDAPIPGCIRNGSPRRKSGNLKE